MLDTHDYHYRLASATRLTTRPFNHSTGLVEGLSKLERANRCETNKTKAISLQLFIKEIVQYLPTYTLPIKAALSDFCLGLS